MLALTTTAMLATAASAKAPQIGVSPLSGGRSAKFTVSFRAPDAARTQGGLSRVYTVSAVDHVGAPGCVSQASTQVTHAAAHTRVRVTLSPKGSGGTAWCRGTFHGQVTEISRPLCVSIRGDAMICPMFVVFDRRVGTFTFRVR